MPESGVLLEAELPKGKSGMKRTDLFYYYMFWPVFQMSYNVTPNQVTYLRGSFCFLLGYLIKIGYLKTAAALFIFMALLDGLDGAMARIQGSITSWGKIVDPIADKGQTITVLIFLDPIVMACSSYTWLSKTMISIDLTLLAVALLQWLIHDKLPPKTNLGRLEKWLLAKFTVRETGANNWGKGKMVVLVVTLSAMLLFNPNASYFIFRSWELPWNLKMYSFFQPLLVSCIILGLMSLKGHVQTIKRLK